MDDIELSEAIAKIEAAALKLCSSETLLGRQLLHHYISIRDEALAEQDRRRRRAAA
jgi:hypothetical protein